MKESPYLDGRDDLLPKMTALPSLAGFNEKYLRQIMQLSKVRQYEIGEIIIKQNQIDSWIYILISGAVRVERDGEVLGRLKRVGDLFGEMGVINSEPRSASVIADKQTICLAMDASVFDRQSPEDQLAFNALFYRLFSEVLSRRLRETSEELAKLKTEMDDLKYLCKQAGLKPQF